MSDAFTGGIDEHRNDDSDADVIDQLLPADPEDAPPPLEVTDDIEVNPADSWEQALPVDGTFDEHR